MLSSILMFLFGCGSDPILDKVAERKEEIKSSSMSSGPKPSTQKPKEPQPKEPQPKEPQPKGPQPKDPLPKEPKEPKEAKPKEPKPKDPQGSGPKIKIEGTIALDSWNGNEIRVDVFDGDQRNLDGPRPKVVATKRIEKPGAFSLSLPKNETGFWIGAYCDMDGDGKPGSKDPSGWFLGNPIQGDLDHRAIQIDLTIPEEIAP